jgi:hypothetical protein
MSCDVVPLLKRKIGQREGLCQMKATQNKLHAPSGLEPPPQYLEELYTALCSALTRH